MIYEQKFDAKTEPLPNIEQEYKGASTISLPVILTIGEVTIRVSTLPPSHVRRVFKQLHKTSEVKFGGRVYS